MTENKPHLVRGLGAWASGAIVVGTMIGTGIFLKPAEMAQEGHSLFIVFAAWIVGGMLSLFGALSYAELGAAVPEAGGEYAYLSRAYGPVWGFLFGWTYSIVGSPASQASIAAGMMLFASFLFPAIANPIFTVHLAIPGLTHWLAPYDFAFTWMQPLAALWLFVMAGVNYFGVRLGGAVQVFLTTIKILSIAVVIGVVFIHPASHSHSMSPLWPASVDAHLLKYFFAALAAALWAYDGWSNLNLVGSEISEPGRNIPRSLIGGVALVATMYILFSAVCFKALPFSEIAASQHVASDVVESVVGHGAAAWITLAMVIAALGALNSSVLTGARVPYAMSRDGIFFRATEGIHPKYLTPYRALLFEAVMASILALSGTFDELTSLFIFASWIFYGSAVSTVFRLRYKEPNLLRPYRCWGYPLVPGVFVISALALTISIWMERPGRSSIGLLLMLAGLPFYYWWTKKKNFTTEAQKTQR